MDTEKKNPVSQPCQAYNEMAKHWELIDDLLGGTLAMRKAGTTWLPREPKEDDESYNARLGRSILFEGYEDATSDLASRPFSKPVTMQGTLPESLQEVYDNPDGQGTDITQFAKDILSTCIHRGIAHILVDFPKTPAGDGVKTSIADERRAGYRPIFVHIKPDQLIGWKSVIENGKTVLDMIRWKDTKTIYTSDFEEKKINIVRVYTRVGWQLWEENDKKEYVLVEDGGHTYPDGIPLVTCYINKTGFMTAKPAMLGLAWMNLAHWQSYSDQKNLLRFARFPLLFFSGINEADIEKDVVIGPGRKWSSTNENADCKFVEHTGAGIEAGQKDISDIEKRMELLGLEPLLSRSGDQTATGQSIDEAKSQSAIQSWIRAVETALRTAFEMAAKWLKTKISEEFNIDIYNDFGVSVRASADIDALLRMRQARDIDRITLLRETKRRGLLSEMTDPEEVSALVDSEGPALGLMTANPDGEEGDNDE